MPTGGTVPALANSNDPLTLALPPESEESDNAEPMKIEEADGAIRIVGVALPMGTVTCVVAGAKLSPSAGVKITSALNVPTEGLTEACAKEKDPETEPEPPDNIASARL